MQHAWYVVAFGANQGDARAMLDEVIERWSALESARSVWCSKLYASVPVGTHRTSAYHNAVLIVESTLTEPAAFFAQMQQLETNSADTELAIGAREPSTLISSLPAMRSWIQPT